MSDSAERLKETSDKCLASLGEWNKDLNNLEVRENLIDSVHELRKVVSRLEIDIAMNDRKKVNSKPIPLPKHKSQMNSKNQKPLSEILPVAEIKEARQKKKIAIQEANNKKEQTPETENNSASEDKTETRKPRRKKYDENNNDS